MAGKQFENDNTQGSVEARSESANRLYESAENRGGRGAELNESVLAKVSSAAEINAAKEQFSKPFAISA